MVDHARRTAASFRDGEVRKIDDDMQRITLGIASKCLFDTDIDGEGRAFGEASHAIMEFFEARMSSLLPLPLWVPTPSNRKIRRALQAADRLVYDLMARRRRSGEHGSDVLVAEYEGGGHMADKQVRDEAFSLLIAGQEATAVSLMWTFHHLALNPDVDARLQEELRSVLNGRSPEPGDLPRLRYAEQIIKESMRLYPPFYFYGRDTITSCDIGEYRVPAGVTLFVSPWLIQRDQRYFEQPLAFDPGRWAENAAKGLPKYAYFPFGGGSRACVASAFSMMETVLVLATLAQSFRFEPVPGHTVTPWPVVTIRPKHGIKLKITRR
jgi:cytochrome P450